MKAKACGLIQKYPTSFSSGSFLSAWKRGSDEASLLFGLFTTQNIGSSVVSPTDELVIISEEISKNNLIEMIPEKVGDEVNIEFSIDSPEVGSITFNQHRQPRICRRTSQEMEIFGMEYPAICGEYWPLSDSGPSIDEEVEVLLRDSMKENFDIDFDEHSEYVGMIIAAIEDRRARIRYNESGRELVRRMHEDVEALSDEEILDLHDTWVIEFGSVSGEDVDITLRCEEYGKLLNEKSVSLSSSNRVSRDSAIEFIRSNQDWPSRLKTVFEDSIWRYELPDIPSSGASEIIMEISDNGVLLDQYSQPVMRTINFDVDVISGSSPAPTADNPTKIFEGSDYTVGSYSWDQRLALSGESDLANWIVEDDSDYDDVMEVVHDLLTGTVKLVDPYLRPGRLSDLLDESNQDVNLWVITALPSDEMQNRHLDFESVVSTASQTGKDLHICWIPNSPTPLHDRFLLSENRSLTFGTSFNSLQSNLTVVHEISDEKAKQLEQNFDYWWTDSRFKTENNVELIDTTY